jgi:hypothetical protein
MKTIILNVDSRDLELPRIIATAEKENRVISSMFTKGENTLVNVVLSDEDNPCLVKIVEALQGKGFCTTTGFSKEDPPEKRIRSSMREFAYTLFVTDMQSSDVVRFIKEKIKPDFDQVIDTMETPFDNVAVCFVINY